MSSGERLSQKYGAGASGGKKPEECVIARIVPKSVSLGSVDAAAKANGVVSKAAAASKNDGGIAAKRYKPAAVNMNGKLARSIAAAKTAEAIAGEAFAPKAKPPLEADAEPEGAVFEADEAAESGVQGVAPQEAFEGLRESVGHYAGMAAAAMTDGMTVNGADASPDAMSEGKSNAAAVSVPGAVPSVTAGGEPAATPEFTSDFSPEFSPDVISGSTPHSTLAGTPHVVVGGSPVVTADGMNVNVTGTPTGSSSGVIPTVRPNTAAVSVPGAVPSVTVGGEPAGTPEFTSDFSPEALQRPSAAGSGSEPSVRDAAVRRDAGASPGPNEPYGNSPQAYAGGGPLNAVSNDGAEGDEEKARMERMSTNYERDREILAKEDPAFSRTTFRDVGHAMSDAEFDFNEKNSRRRMRNDVEKVISKVRL